MIADSGDLSGDTKFKKINGVPPGAPGGEHRRHDDDLGRPARQLAPVPAGAAVPRSLVMIRAVPGRLRAQDGMGLVELLAAMLILTIAISALLTAFAASVKSLARSGQEGTALLGRRPADGGLPGAALRVRDPERRHRPQRLPGGERFPEPVQRIAAGDGRGRARPPHVHRDDRDHVRRRPTNQQKQVIVSVTSAAGTELARVGVALLDPPTSRRRTTP